MIIGVCTKPIVLTAHTYCYDADGKVLDRIVELDTETKTAVQWQDPGGHEVTGEPCSTRRITVDSFEFVVASDTVEKKLLRLLPETLHRYIRRGDKARMIRLGSITTGKTLHEIKCCCGHRNYFFARFWTGRGESKCHVCGRYIRYTTLDVVA